MHKKYHLYSIIKHYIILIFLLISILSFTKSDKISKNIKIKESKNYFGRILEEEVDTNKICSHADEKLQEYYKTGKEDLVDMSTLDGSPKLSKAVQAIIDILNEKGKKNENLLKYLIHLIPAIVFLIIGVLAIPGWFICCCSSCCNCCCCCCCCKKPKCKISCFYTSLFFYVFPLVLCVYGLIYTNKVFRGISNTECTLMKLIDEVDQGETKDSQGKWVGFNGISNLFDEAKKKVNEMKVDTLSNLAKSKQDKIDAEDSFDAKLEDACTFAAKDDFKLDLDNSGNKYRLDVIENFGTKDSTKESTFTYRLNKEYSLLSESSGTLMDQVDGKFTEVFTGNDITSTFDNAEIEINFIKQPIEDVKKMVTKYIKLSSQYIDEYGKLSFLLIYGILCFFLLTIISLFFIIFFISNKLITKDYSYKGCLKCLVHINWNILAFFMIISFFLGFILCLIGLIGKDGVSLIKYIISDKNLKSEKPLIAEGESSKYLDVCINGDGQIVNQIGITGNTATSSIEKLNNLNHDISEIIKKFEEIQKSQTIINYQQSINDITNYESDIKLCEEGSFCANNKKLNDLIQEFNNDISTTTSFNEEWNLKCPADKIINCINSNPITSGKCLQPQDCYKENFSIKDRYTSDSTISNKGNRIDLIIKSIFLLDTKSSTNTDHLLQKLIDLQNKYKSYADTEIENLKIYQNTIKNLTNIFGENNTSVYSFLNCKFIGKNTFILLNFLKKSLGNYIYSVGIALLMASCSLIFAISTTILLIILNNAGEKLENQSNNGNNNNNHHHQQFEEISYEKEADPNEIYLNNEQVIALPSPENFINSLNINPGDINTNTNSRRGSNTKVNQVFISEFQTGDEIISTRK